MIARECFAILIYDAGPFPIWRVNAANVPVHKLEREDYQASDILTSRETG